MTIEEKVREVALNLWRDSQGTSMYPNKEGNKQINQATQAILALMKPMSDSGVIEADEVTLAFFRKYLEMPNGTLEDLCNEIIGLKKMKPMNKETMIQIMLNYTLPDNVICGEEEFSGLADAILAEWGKK